MDTLLDKVLLKSEQTYEEATSESEKSRTETPRSMSAQFEHPDKDEAIEKFKTKRRFSY